MSVSVFRKCAWLGRVANFLIVLIVSTTSENIDLSAAQQRSPKCTCPPLVSDPAFTLSSFVDSFVVVEGTSKPVYGDLDNSTCGTWYRCNNNSQIVSVDLSSQSLSGNISSDILELRHLRSLNLFNNSITGPIPPSLGSSLNLLVYLHLGRNQLSSTIPPSLGNSLTLTYLNLSYNQLSGQFPQSLGKLVELSVLDLSHNSLSGPIPANLTWEHMLSFNISSNNLCIPYSSIPSAYDNYAGFANNSCIDTSFPGPPKNSGLSDAAIIGITAGSVLFILLVALFVFLWVLRMRKKGKADLEEQAGGGEGLGQRGFGDLLMFRKFDFPLTSADIVAATDRFSDKHKIGAGSFGTVFRATLPDGKTEVAIKMLPQGQGDLDPDFETELRTLAQVTHKNLLPVIGAYVHPDTLECFIIYDFMRRGTMEDLLYEKDPAKFVLGSWPLRVDILRGVARALKYLHHDCRPAIIHRDMKPANVLFDTDLIARVADFGLARIYNTTKTHVTTGLCGTVGYLAPEYAALGRLNEKCDVFSYGVVLLELLTAVEPYNSKILNIGLSRWVSNYQPMEVVDRRLQIEGETERIEVLAAFKLGALCTSDAPRERPTMEEVVYILDHLAEFYTGGSRS